MLTQKTKNCPLANNFGKNLLFNMGNWIDEQSDGKTIRQKIER